MRPKLLAIKVSGFHLVPMILRASSRDRQARAGEEELSRPVDQDLFATAVF
jgi:hypothetical protein